VLLTAAFIFVESRAVEPIIPLELFNISVFRTSNIYSFILGFAMFGAIVFLPVYLQVVHGYSPTRSGLAFLPMVVGIFSTSISSGIVMSKTGRYKIFPILGSVMVIVALFLLSTLTVSSPYWQAAIWFWMFGAGLGFSMQIVVTIVQNAVDRRHMGTATSSVAFFRSMGGTFGAAVFGAILTARLTTHLAEHLGSGSASPVSGSDTSNVSKIQALPEPVKGFVLQAFADSLHDVFLWAIPVVLIALVVSLFIRELPLKARQAESEPIADPEEIALAT
jgi:MFS family permease